MASLLNKSINFSKTPNFWTVDGGLVKYTKILVFHKQNMKIAV